MERCLQNANPLLRLSGGASVKLGIEIIILCATENSAQCVVAESDPAGMGRAPRGAGVGDFRFWPPKNK
jgi:hypothetical protein